MMMQRSKSVLRRFGRFAPCLFAATIAFSIALSTATAQQTPPANPAELLTAPGLNNAARVSGNLYRGAQPKADGYAELKKLGIDVVVSFLDGNHDIQKEKDLVESAGMTFISVPWNAVHDPPRSTVVLFFATLRDNEGKKIFVNDVQGADRTGLMVALYRIVHDHWTVEQAAAEMNDFHFHRHAMPHMAHYVEAFPALLASDPGILTGGPAPAAAPKN
jgi:protein tyrosine/serine phosphatase